MRILIIEDEDRVADFLTRGLAAEGHSCIRAATGEDGLVLAKTADFSVIILDLMLPGMHGLEVCQELRRRKITTPVLVLTAMDELDDVVTGLQLGADDYITKPFAFDELVARVNALARRSGIDTDTDSTIRFGDIVYDRETVRVTVNDEPVEMTAKEIAILELLISHPGKLFSRERILSNIWGIGMDPMTNVVDVYIGKIRKKIDRDENQSYIETVRGFGYRLTNPAEKDAGNMSRVKEL